MLENIITLGYESEKYSLIHSHFVYVTYLCYQMFFLAMIFTVVKILKGNVIRRVYLESTGKLFNVVSTFYRQKLSEKSYFVSLNKCCLKHEDFAFIVILVCIVAYFDCRTRFPIWTRIPIANPVAT